MSDFIEEIKQRVRERAGHDRCVETIERLTAQCQELRAACEGAAQTVEVQDAELATLRAQLDEALKDREELRRFAKHSTCCDSIQRDETGCVCGLTSLLTHIDAAKGQQP